MQRKGTTQLAGTGYSMLQLGWEGEAVTVDREGNTNALPVSALEYLQDKGVK